MLSTIIGKEDRYLVMLKWSSFGILRLISLFVFGQCEFFSVISLCCFYGKEVSCKDGQKIICVFQVWHYSIVLNWWDIFTQHVSTGCYYFKIFGSLVKLWLHWAKTWWTFKLFVVIDGIEHEFFSFSPPYILLTRSSCYCLVNVE